MPIVKLPDGTLVQLPDTPATPAPELSLLDKGKLIAEVAMDKIGRPLARGGLDLIQGIDTTLRNSPSPLGRVYEAATGMARIPQPNAEAVLPTPQGETKAETYARRMLEGAPQAVFGGPSTIIPSMLGPAAGQAARDYVGGISPKLAPIADVLANVLTQSGMGLASGMRQGWPSSSADEAAADTGVLTKMGLNRIGPQKSGLSVANQTSAAANAAERGVEKQATEAFASTLGNAKLRPAQAAGIYNYLRNEAARIETTGVGQKGEAEALRKIADQFVRGDKQGFVTDVPSLSLQIKQFKLDPNQTSISDNNLKSAIATAETALGDIVPEFAQANKVYAYVKQNMERPLKEGVIGRLSDTNPYPADPTSPGRLNALVRDTSPQDQGAALAGLQAHGASIPDIARAIAAKKVEAGGLSPGVKIFGGPGSQQEENMTSLLNAAGVSPERVRAPLAAADAIAQALKGGNTSLSEQASVHSGGLSLRGQIRPGIVEKVKSLFFGSAGSQEIAKLLETASPEEAAQLRQLANYDPQLRIALTLAGMGRAALPNSDVIRKGQ